MKELQFYNQLDPGAKNKATRRLGYNTRKIDGSKTGIRSKIRLKSSRNILG